MISRLSVDRFALPGALLPLVKNQARVRHERDDALISTHISSAISLIERLCNVSLDPATYAISADEVYSCQALRPSPTRWLLPLNNVRTFIVTDAEVDISAGFALWNPDYGGNASSYLQSVNGGTMPWSSGLALAVGVEDPTELSPAFASLIARMTASMYENREANAELWAGNYNAELLALWRPYT